MFDYLARIALCFALVGMAALLADAADTQKITAKSLDGKYRATCTNPDGSKGEGTVLIEWLEGNKVKFTSIYGTKDVGFGTLKGNVLSVKYRGKVMKERTGEAEYTVDDNGVLEGWWHYGDNKKRPEKLIPRKKD